MRSSSVGPPLGDVATRRSQHGSQQLPLDPLAGGRPKTLFVVGPARSLVTARTWLRSGVEMLLVGAAAAAVAYGVGALVADLVGGTAVI